MSNENGYSVVVAWLYERSPNVFEGVRRVEIKYSNEGDIDVFCLIHDNGDVNFINFANVYYFEIPEGLGAKNDLLGLFNRN